MSQPLLDLVPQLRAMFPALARQVDGQPLSFLDGPAGTQVPQSVIDAISHYLIHSNANRHGPFVTAAETEAMFREAHETFAGFVGADDPDEIVFGPNATSLTFAMSRSISQTWDEGDEIIVTRLDHDSNVSPWKLAAKDKNVEVHFVGFDKATGRLDLEELKSLLNENTRLVAVGAASNATGGINPVAEIASLAHEVGALCYVDAVHLGPHRLIDVQAWDADFVVCSAYKFFGPHVGILWGQRDLLEDLKAYKVRPASNAIPEKWMTGTQNHEGIAGATACVKYLADIGIQVGADSESSLRSKLEVAFAAITDYERKLSLEFLAGLQKLGGFEVYGITDPNQFDQRCSTFSIRHQRVKAADLAYELGSRGIFTWAGHYYALEFSEQMGFEPEGMLRIGFVHYNTMDEVRRVLEALSDAVDGE